MTININEAIKIVASYRKHAGKETQQVLDCIIWELERYIIKYDRGMAKQYEEVENGLHNNL